MKMIYLFIWLILFILLISCANGGMSIDMMPSETMAVPMASLSPDMASNTAPPLPQPTATAVTADYSQDAWALVTEIEKTHPIFLIEGELPEYYNDVKALYIACTSKPLTGKDFMLATQQYLTVLQDGHMGGGLSNYEKYLDIRWGYENASLFLLTPDGALSDMEVIEIGGIPVKEVTSQIDRYYYAENEAA